MKHVWIGSAVAGAALALTSTPAQAAGTVHNNYPEQCYRYDDYTVCYSSSDQYNHVVTPSGNESYVGKGTSTYSISGPDFSYRDTYRYQFHVLYKAGEPQVYHEKFSDTWSFDGETCTFAQDYHFANGAVRHYKPTFTCA